MTRFAADTPSIRKGLSLRECLSLWLGGIDVLCALQLRRQLERALLVCLFRSTLPTPDQELASINNCLTPLLGEGKFEKAESSVLTKALIEQIQKASNPAP